VKGVAGDVRLGWRRSKRRQMMVEKSDERDLMIFHDTFMYRSNTMSRLEKMA